MSTVIVHNMSNNFQVQAIRQRKRGTLKGAGEKNHEREHRVRTINKCRGIDKRIFPTGKIIEHGGTTLLSS